MPAPRTITASSHIAGTYAPPAVQEPSTAATCRKPVGGEDRLIPEDPAEVLLVGEDLALQRKKRAAGVDQVEARAAGS